METLENREVKWVADIGSNHNGDWNRIRELIEVSKEIGCWGVKFQLFKADKLYHESYGHYLHINKMREFPEDFLKRAGDYCRNIGIKCGVTPFYLEGVDVAKDWVDFFKISSFDVLREDLINKCIEVCGNEKPLVISIGSALCDEIVSIGSLVRKVREVYFLDCISLYPTPVIYCDIEKSFLFLKGLKFMGNVDVGWSDHTGLPGVLYNAFFHGANMIEFHLDLDGKGWEYRDGHCWKPRQIGRVIDDIEIIKASNKMRRSMSCVYEEVKEDIRNSMADPTDGLRPLISKRSLKVLEREGVESV